MAPSSDAGIASAAVPFKLEADGTLAVVFSLALAMDWVATVEPLSAVG